MGGGQKVSLSWGAGVTKSEPELGGGGRQKVSLNWGTRNGGQNGGGCLKVSLSWEAGVPKSEPELGVPAELS